MEETIRPSITDLITDCQCATGLRLLIGILEREMVSMVANVMIVRLERTSEFRVSPGKIPVKLVINATTRANVIMNALLFANALISIA